MMTLGSEYTVAMATGLGWMEERDKFRCAGGI